MRPGEVPSREFKVLADISAADCSAVALGERVWGNAKRAIGTLNQESCCCVNVTAALAEQRGQTLGMNAFGQTAGCCLDRARPGYSPDSGSQSRLRRSEETLKKPVAFSHGRRGATRGKTRITIYLDDAIVQRFKSLSEQTGKGYPTLINEALSVPENGRQLTASQIRTILREELPGERGGGG